MSDGVAAVAMDRRGSAGLLVCGVLVCAAFWIEGMPRLAVSGFLLIAALAGAVRQVQAGSGRGEHGQESQALGSDRQAAPGMADRAMLEARLEEEGRRERRAGEPTALLLIGVDEFDRLQAQGALTADVAMLTVASTLTRMLPRAADLLARYDERTFAVVLRGTDLSGSLRVAARLRWAIVRLAIANPQTESGLLTVCIGVAVQHELTAGGREKLMVAAEAALGAAQQGGTDRLEYVEFAESRAIDAGESSRVLPAIRAWTPEHARLYSPQG